MNEKVWKWKCEPANTNQLWIFLLCVQESFVENVKINLFFMSSFFSLWYIHILECDICLGGWISAYMIYDTSVYQHISIDILECDTCLGGCPLISPITDWVTTHLFIKGVRNRKMNFQRDPSDIPIFYLTSHTYMWRAKYKIQIPLLDMPPFELHLKFNI